MQTFNRPGYANVTTHPLDNIHALFPLDLGRSARRLGTAQEELLHELLVAQEWILIKCQLDTVARLDVVEFLDLNYEI